ncbi:transposase, partial [Candidatus Poribacteria bacterium]|nr:transposase [Candidatus Poribacteria bacterium]
SRTCHVCGAVNQALNLRDRTWQRPNCHTQLDRDRNAAVNIHKHNLPDRVMPNRQDRAIRHPIGNGGQSPPFRVWEYVNL